MSLPIRTIAELGELDHLYQKAATLVEARSIDLVFASHSENPHVKRIPELPVEDQLARLATENPSTFCVYPTAASLKGIVDEAKFAGLPYSRRLAFAEPQLIPVYFELRVLQQYFTDPRYYCRFWDRSGTISITDEHYKSETMPEKHQVMLQSFGIGYNEQRHRVVVVFLRYLSDLSPEHPRRSPQLTHLCSREMTQTEITV